MTEEKIRSKNLATTRGAYLSLPARLNDEIQLDEWNRRVNDPDEIIAIDLFCGAGGMSLGLEDAGIFVAAGIDADKVAAETHAHNLLSKTRVVDLGQVEDPAAIMQELGIPRVDIIVGGPPCQGFSIAGRNKLRSLEAHDPGVMEEVDRKNRLYKEFVGFVAVLQPLIFVMENVPHLSTYGQGVIAGEIRRDFEQLGYLVENFTLDSSDFGVPQTRRRLFFIGRLKNRGIDSCRPRPDFRQKQTLRDAIGDLPEVEAPSLLEELPYDPARPGSNAYQQLMRSRVPTTDQHMIRDHVVRPVRDDDRIIFQLMEQGHRYYDVPEQYRRYNPRSFGDKYHKLRWDSPCHTITASASNMLHLTRRTTSSAEPGVRLVSSRSAPSLSVAKRPTPFSPSGKRPRAVRCFQRPPRLRRVAGSSHAVITVSRSMPSPSSRISMLSIVASFVDSRVSDTVCASAS